MTDEQNNLSESPVVHIDLESPGAMLATARQTNNVSIDQAAKELFITAGKLQALEQDQFEQFNSPIFVRGYLRSYAKFLKIDGDQVVAAFDELLAARAPKSTQAELKSLPENPQKQLWRFGAIIAGIFFVIYMISIWFFDNGKESQNKSLNVTSATLAPSIDNLPAPEAIVNNISSSASSISQSVGTGVAVTSTISVATKVESSSSRASTSVATASISSRAVAATQSSIAATQSSIAAVQSSKVATNPANTTLVKNQRLDEINFSFREESWLEVSDSRGDVLVTELQSAGSHLTLTGVAPFDVKLGNSPGVDVKINGKKYPITPLITSKVLILKVTN